MTWGTYGGRSGVWRLLKIFGENQVPATFISNARALEINPGVAEEIVRQGHEVAAHSYAQDDLLSYLGSGRRACADPPVRRPDREAYRIAAQGLAQSR